MSSTLTDNHPRMETVTALPTYEMPSLISLPMMPDPFGNLTFVDGENALPFAIKRAYFITGIPSEATRGGHAHKLNHEFLVALSGGFTVHLESPEKHCCEFRLEDPTIGLFVPALHWRVIDHYEPNSTCLVLASEHYSERDYVRDYDVFQQQAAFGFAK